MADEPDAAQWAVVLWNTKPDKVEVVPRKDVRINKAGEWMAKWDNIFRKIKKIVAESDDLQYLAKLKFSPDGKQMPKTGRPSKKAFTSLDQSLLRAKSMSDGHDDDGLLADEIAGIDVDAEDEEDSEAGIEENETENGKVNARNDDDLEARINDKEGDKEKGTVKEALDGLCKFKRYDRINHIYEISEGETEDEHGAINSLAQRDDRMDESEYKRCVTQLCTRSRLNGGKKGKQTEAKGNRAADKDVVEEVNIDVLPMATADQSGDNGDQIIPEPVQKRPDENSHRDKILEYPANGEVTGGSEGLKDIEDGTDGTRGLKDTRSGKKDTRESSEYTDTKNQQKKDRDAWARRSPSRLTDRTSRESVERQRERKYYSERRSKYGKKRVTRSRSRGPRRDSGYGNRREERRRITNSRSRSRSKSRNDRRGSRVRDGRGESRSRDHWHRYAVSGSMSRYGQTERESDKYYRGGYRSR